MDLGVGALGCPRHGGEVMTNVTQKWRSQRVTAALYDAGVKHDSVARIGAWAMWGTDIRPMFTDIERLADVPVGALALDVPCGGCLAFRGLRTGRAVRYVAATYLPTCSSEPAGGGPAGGARRDRVRRSRCDRAAVR